MGTSKSRFGAPSHAGAGETDFQAGPGKVGMRTKMDNSENNVGKTASGSKPKGMTSNHRKGNV